MFAGLSPANIKLRYHAENHLVPPWRDSIPVLTGLNKKDSLRALCDFAVKKNFLFKQLKCNIYLPGNTPLICSVLGGKKL